MSAPAFAWALERGATLKLLAADRLVLIYLADMANGERVCWPGQEKIVEFTGLALRTVRTALQRLEGLQLIRAEAKDGYVTKYHVLRPTTPANGAVVTPAKQHGATPANWTPPPRQMVPTHPGKSSAEPRQMVPRTPANGTPDPSKTQERDPRARVRAREEGKNLDFEEVGKQAAPPPAPRPDAPPISTTTGGAAPLRSSDAFLDDPSPDDALPKAEGELDAADQPVDPATALREFARVKQALRARNYPPRAAVLDRQEQIEHYQQKRTWKTLSRDQLAAARKLAGIWTAPS